MSPTTLPRSSIVAVVVAAVALGFGSAVGAERGAPRPVSISFPRDGDMVRGHVPVFGTAWCEGFRRFRVEFGEGRQPERWHVMRVAEKPEREDPWAAGKVRWHPDRGVKGNLATWDTGRSKVPGTLMP